MFIYNINIINYKNQIIIWGVILVSQKELKMHLVETEERSFMVFDFLKLSRKEVENLISNFLLPEKALRKFSEYAESLYENNSRSFWYSVSRNQKLSEDFIRDYSEKLNWEYITSSQELSEDFVIEFSDKIYWYDYSANKKLSKRILEKCTKKISWSSFFRYNVADEYIFSKYQKEVLKNMWYVCEYQKLPESFMRKYSEELHWSDICRHQILSEEFMHDFRDNLHWDVIAECQPLSKSFILAYADKLKEQLLRKNVKIDRKSLGYGFWKMLQTARKMCS